MQGNSLANIVKLSSIFVTAMNLNDNIDYRETPGIVIINCYRSFLQKELLLTHRLQKSF